MWNKVTKFSGRGSNLQARQPRATPAVSRNRTGGRVATLILPDEYVTGERANVYSDGNGKLAFALGQRGEYSVFDTSPKARAKKVTIPSTFAGRIPFGTTDAKLTREGDMLVLDLSQFTV